MAIKIKKGGTYVTPVAAFFKKNGVYTALQGLFAKSNGAYQAVLNSVPKNYGFMRLIGTQNNQVAASPMTSPYNSAVIKLQAPGGAIGARVVVTNSSPNFSLASMKAAMASTEISACDTTANAYTPQVGGTTYSVISSTTSDKGFIKAKWNGNNTSRRLYPSNPVLPSFGYNNQEDIIVSDMIPLVPKRATDRTNEEYYYILRVTGTGVLNQDGQSQIGGGGSSFATTMYTEWVNSSGADSPLICVGDLSHNVDAVDGNIATIPGAVTGGYSPVVHVEWFYPSNVTPISIWHVGDSITESYEWPRWAVNRKNTNPLRPLHHANIGGSTTRTASFLGEMYLHLQALGRPDYVLMNIISINNYSPRSDFDNNPAMGTFEYNRLVEVAQYLTNLGIKIIWWVPFNYGPNPAASDTSSAWGILYNSAKAYAAANGITFMDINGDSRFVRLVYDPSTNPPTNPTGWIDKDNTHPSNPTGKNGFATIYTETLTALGL